MKPAFTAEAAFLDAAERARRIESVVGIQPDDARLKSAGDLKYFAAFVGPHPGGESESSVVGTTDCFFRRTETHHREYRSEDLFTGDDMVGLDVREEAGLAPESFVWKRRGARLMHGGAFRGSLSEISLDRRQLWAGVDRADVGVFVEGIADSECSQSTFELCDDLREDRFLDEEPAPGATNMALVEPDALHNALNRLIDGGVGKDDVRALAAKFEGESLARACGGGRDPFSNLG